ncbi:MAG: ABC transporter ATP-binding protein [Anaerolineae bacterium]|nr:ABC transporter ATP-binding protein [Anaerolineae bacterium]
MSSEVHLLDVESVSKKFCRNLKRSLWYGAQDLASEFIGRKSSSDLRPQEFWAVQDVSFALKRSDSLGIIGNNGAGKTTMLRLISGLIKPNLGRITLRGRVGALIALGAGFNPILTGRENIYINAAVLGISKKEADKLIDEIIDFSEIREFIDMPVQHYSSGMHVRLGFSVAAHLNPDIFLVDEVLSVGDYAFREKSFARMSQLYRSGAAIIFISHNLPAVTTICEKVIWMEHGRIRMFGDADTVIKAYMDHEEETVKDTIRQEADKHTETSDTLFNQMRITRIDLLNQKEEETTTFHTGDDLHLRIHYEAYKPIPEPHFVVQVGTPREVILVADMLKDQIAPKVIEGKGYVDCIMKNIPLLPNRYSAHVFVLGQTAIIKIVFPPKEVPFVVESNHTTSDLIAAAKLRPAGIVPVESQWNW